MDATRGVTALIATSHCHVSVDADADAVLAGMSAPGEHSEGWTHANTVGPQGLAPGAAGVAAATRRRQGGGGAGHGPSLGMCFPRNRS